MFTVTQLARECGLSRTALLYYESAGLLKPAVRAANNYRKYGDGELHRVRQICAWRKAGLSLADIRELLKRPESDVSSILKRRLIELDVEIEQLRAHQRAILALLRAPRRRTDRMTKEKWVEIMKAAGFTEADMQRWHAEFEKSAPDDHQQFLEYLHIGADEIRRIRHGFKKQ